MCNFLKNFDEEDEEDAPLKPTAIGRLGRAIEPGDRSKLFISLSECYCMMLVYCKLLKCCLCYV